MRTYKGHRADIPHDIVMQVRYKLAGYDRLLQERDCILHGSAAPANGMPHGNGVGHPAEEKAIKLAYINAQINAIEATVEEIKCEYGKKVLDGFDPIRAYWNYNYFNYRHKRRSLEDEGPSDKTWRRYKILMTAKIANKLKLF